MLFSRLRYLTLLGLIVLLTGCGLFTTKEKPNITKIADEKLWQQHALKIAELTTWQVDGKVGIKTSKDSGSATLFWLQQFDYYDIRLSGPLGRGATRIVGKKGNVTMEVSGQGRFTATTPEELLQQQLGWDLPVSNLVWWIKGLPAPDTPYTNVLNSDSRLQQLTQNNWTIEYKDYQDHAGYWLPERIIAKSQDIQITLVAKQWTLRKMGKELAAN